MNPFNIKRPATAPVRDHSTDDFLREHGVDPSIQDELLAVAVAEEEKRTINPSVEEPAMPPEDTPLNTHREIMIIPNFLSEDICEEYIEYIKKDRKSVV